MIKKFIPLGSRATYESHILQKEETEGRRRIISTGCKSLDAMLGGGVKTSEVTEFYGAPFVGKTQLCHGLCAFTSQCGIDGKSVYVDTEGSFRRERICEIAEKRGYDFGLALKNIKDVKVNSCNEQEEYLNKLELMLIHVNSGDPYRLIVVDSVISNYKAEFSGRENLSKRQQKLYAFMKKLNRIANIYNIAIVITNHINEVPDTNEFPKVKPAGGNVMGYNVTHRIAMGYRPGRYLASIYSSKYLMDNKIIYYSIGLDGIKDY